MDSWLLTLGKKANKYVREIQFFFAFIQTCLYLLVFRIELVICVGFEVL